MAIRFSCGSTKRKAILHGKSVEAANLPEVVLSCQVSLRGNGLPHQCAHWLAMTCRRRGRVRECKDVGRVRCAEGRACQRVQGPPPLSLRGAKRRGNPYSLQWGRTRSNTLGEYEKHCEFALSTTDLPGIAAGMRIATPVCALVRNDMQKEEALLRL